MKTQHILLLLLFVVNLYSCEDFFDRTVDIEVEKKPSKIAVFGYLESDKDIHKITVTSSNSILQKTPQSVEDATVTLYKNGVKLDTVTNQGYYSESNNKYFSYDKKLNIEENDAFKIEVSVPNLPNVSGSSIVPPSIDIQNVAYNGKKYNIAYDYHQYEVKVSIKDNPNEKNFYAVSMHKITPRYYNYVEINGEQVPLDTIYNKEPLYLVSGNDSNLFEDDYFLTISDEVFNGNTYDIRAHIDEYDVHEGEDETYEVTVSSITEDLYNYGRTSHLLFESEGNPFAEPVILYSNIENGYGIFALSRNYQYELKF